MNKQKGYISIIVGGIIALIAMIGIGVSSMNTGALSVGGNSNVAPLPVRNFLGLTDTPDSYSGQGGKVVSVKSDASGLEFTTEGAGSMIYPGAGIALSTGSAWDTSITNNSGNWNTAYGWGNHATAGYVTGTPWTSAGYLTDAPSDGSTYGRLNGAWSAVVAGGGDMILNAIQSVTGLKTFDKDKLAMKGTSTGVNTLSVANTSATSYTNTLPAKNGTFAMTDDLHNAVTLGTPANGLSLSTQELSLGLASTSTIGALSNTDWNTFNGKLGSALTSANIFVGNGSNVATGVALSGDASLSNAGVLGVNKTRLNVRNETGVTIASTKAVYTSTFNNFPLIALADNTDETKHGVLGVTIAPIGHEANGFIATSGQFDAETNSWTVGTTLYLSTGGALTSTMPTSGAVKIIGTVTVQSNYPTGKILLASRQEEHILAGGANTDVILRTGDTAGTNKFSFRDYANSEVASINSDGALTAVSLIKSGGTSSQFLKADGSVDTSTYLTSSTGANTALSNLASVAINTTLLSDTDNTDALGTTAIAWSDLFLGSGSVIQWNSAPSTSDITLTHSANQLTLAGGSLALGSNSLALTGSISTTSARVTKGWFTDLEITNLPTVNGGTLATALSLGTMASETATNYVAKSLFDANTVLYATTDNTPVALTVGEQTLVGRATGGAISAIAIDSDLASVSANDDTVPSAKATKAMGDLKLPLAGGTMSGNITLGENTSVAYDPAGSADGKYSGLTVAGTAGAALAFGDLVYLDPTDSRWELADANIAAGSDGDPRGILGIVVLAAAGDGSATVILLNGIVRADTAFPALTINAPVYVSETAGDVVVTQPTTADVVIRVLGFAITADEMYFNPSSDYITHT